MEELSQFLINEFPELSYESLMVPHGNYLEMEEYSKAFKYIKENKIIQDARNILFSEDIMRNSVTYPVVFPDQKNDLEFKVEWIQGSAVFVGLLQKPDASVYNARLYGMRIEE